MARCTAARRTISPDASGSIRKRAFPGFTAKYAVQRRVWFEVHDTREAAFRRDRQIEKWNRSWKLRLIEAQNPQWLDMYETLNP
jgi:putative endonuclease